VLNKLVIINEKLEKRLQGHTATASLRPVRVMTDVELSGDGGKAGNDNTSARGRGFRASRRSEVAFMKGTGLVTEATGLPFIISRTGPGTSLIYE